MAEKHVAVCDNCSCEGQLSDPDKLHRFPNRPPQGWWMLATYDVLFDNRADGRTHLCSLTCVKEWAAANG